MRITTGLLDDAVATVHAYRDADVGALTHGDLLDAQAAASQARRAAELLLATFAAEIARRSEWGGLARAEGYSSPQRLIAAVTGGSLADAHRLIAAVTGGSLADAHRLIEAGAVLVDPEIAAGGEVAEASLLADAGETQGGSGAGASSPESVLANALRTGAIGVEAAALIRATLARLRGAADRGLADPADVAALASRLVAKASQLSLAELRRTCERSEANASPAAWREREMRQHEARCVTVGTDPHGMVLISARLDPPSAAPIKAWLDAQVREAFRRRRDAEDSAKEGLDGASEGGASQGGANAGPQDIRSAGQIRADALVALARHGLGCAESASGPKTTVIVRVDIDQLESGLGIARCDSIDAPISVAALREMAVDAQIVPMVMRGESEVLDVGRKRRLFTRAQRLALVERDGGCVWCHAPPSHCDAHHIRWWTRDHGPTDLANGVLLCVSCHHRLHDAGWEVIVTDGRVYMVPPAGVDPAQRPRLAGNARLDVDLAA